MKKRIIIILLAFAFISSSGYAQEKVENTTKPDTIPSVNDTSFSKGNIFTINPFQMIFYGEYQVGWERQVTDKYSYLLGLGVIYRTGKFQVTLSNFTAIPMFPASEYYKGVHFYIGIKQYSGTGIRILDWLLDLKRVSISNIIYFKYEEDINFRLCDMERCYDRFYGYSGISPFIGRNIKLTRDKFVLGYKLLVGLENKKIGRFFYNTYVGAGVHIKYLVFSPYQLDGEIHNDSKLYPEISIHLGFTIGYSTR